MAASSSRSAAVLVDSSLEVEGSEVADGSSLRSELTVIYRIRKTALVLAIGKIENTFPVHLAFPRLDSQGSELAVIYRIGKTALLLAGGKIVKDRKSPHSHKVRNSMSQM